MPVVREIARMILSPAETPDLAVAQWHVISRQLPLMYAMLSLNTVVVALTHLPVAPAVLTIYIPAALCLLATLRGVTWWRNRARDFSPEEAQRGLARMTVMSVVMAVSFVTWSLSLMPYGDSYLRSQIAFYMGITTIGVLFCLIHVRRTAVLVGTIVLVPFCLIFIATGERTFIAIALNMALVVGVLLMLLRNSQRDFAALVMSKRAMAEKQRETQALSEENFRLANLDSLTGIPNRRNFERELKVRLAAAQTAGSAICLARIDVDNFKAVNEIFGHMTGDLLLEAIAQRLIAVKRESTFIARLEGDRFALIMQEPTDSAHIARLACAVRKVFSEAFELPLGIVRVTASVGVSVSIPGCTAETLYDYADYATWMAKRSHRGGLVTFDDGHLRELGKFRRMEQMLHTAHLEDEIYVLLQPQFDVRQGRTTGFEALARWRSPELGEVPPAEFIPMAERTGQICRITQVVLRKALALAETLPEYLRISVNLSANDIGSTTAVEQIVNILSDAPQPGRLDFEITETAVLLDLDQANTALLRLLKLGGRIALDDFGTGHSSLMHVQKLPLHRIKIDRSFVAEVTSDITSRAIIKTMIDMSRNLGISCVFEGIETEEQLETLIAMGGTVMQGYLFGRPMTADQVATYLDEETRLRRVAALVG